jgi:exosortase
MKLKTIIIFIVSAAVLCLIYWPTFRWFANSWLSNDYYSHGFLVPLVSGLIVWTKREHLHRRETSIIGTFLLILGALLYALGFIWEIKVLGALSFLIVLAAILFSIFGIRTVRAMLFPLVFLLFMIPLPFIPDLAYQLQETSVYSSSWLLDVLGLPITSSGPEIHLENIIFTIGLPCSGINTFIALLALAAVYGYILTGSFYKRVILFILAFPIAIVANILRISTIILVAYYGNIETATGWYHNLSSPLFFVIAFLVLVLISWLMRCRLNYELLRRR